MLNPIRTAAIIPAWNEAATVGAVVYAALDARLTDEVIVVDNASSDATATAAAAHGARVVHEPTAGKGEAMRAGVAASDADVIVFLDADLVGLRPHHVDGLVASVVAGDTDMACGLFDEAPSPTRSSSRACRCSPASGHLRRELFEQLDLRDLRGYRVEAALNSPSPSVACAATTRSLPGLWHRTKEEKLGNPVVGHVTKLGMLASACWSYMRFALARRVLGSPRADRSGSAGWAAAPFPIPAWVVTSPHPLGPSAAAVLRPRALAGLVVEDADVLAVDRPVGVRQPLIGAGEGLGHGVAPEPSDVARLERMRHQLAARRPAQEHEAVQRHAGEPEAQAVEQGQEPDAGTQSMPVSSLTSFTAISLAE